MNGRVWRDELIDGVGKERMSKRLVRMASKRREGPLEKSGQVSGSV